VLRRPSVASYTHLGARQAAGSVDADAPGGALVDSGGHRGTRPTDSHSFKRWYLMFPVSYRDLELMLADRGVEVDHTTIFRWIQAYAPELEKRIRRGPHLRPSNGSWRVDET
jgi:hypothetical protein